MANSDRDAWRFSSDLNSSTATSAGRGRGGRGGGQKRYAEVQDHQQQRGRGGHSNSGPAVNADESFLLAQMPAAFGRRPPPSKRQRSESSVNDAYAGGEQQGRARSHAVSSDDGRRGAARPAAPLEYVRNDGGNVGGGSVSGSYRGRGGHSSRGGVRHDGGRFGSNGGGQQHSSHAGQQQPREQQQPRPCWFCLGNADAELHLVVAIGTHWYIALPKGPLSERHALIVPIEHVTDAGTLSPAALDELWAYKRALGQFFVHDARTRTAARSGTIDRSLPQPSTNADSASPVAAAMFFEMSQAGKGFHLHWQAVPLASSEGDQKVSEEHAVAAFTRNGTAIGVAFDVEHVDARDAAARRRAANAYQAIATSARPAAGAGVVEHDVGVVPGSYFIGEVLSLSTQSDSDAFRLVRSAATDNEGSGRRRDGESSTRPDLNRGGSFNVPVSFGRQVAVTALGLPGVMTDWRACTRGSTKEKETELAQDFKKDFAPFDPATLPTTT